MSVPVDEKLYEETKRKVDDIYDKPSAYRSMAYTRFYLRAFREKYGEKKAAYKGKKPGDLEKWRREKWIDIRSFLDTPEDPKPCGAIEYGKKEYPLCMPESKAKRYNKQELSALLYRKSELGKTRLVKEPFLRDLYGKPIKEVKAKDIKPLEEPKVLKEKKVKEPKPEKAPKAKKEEVFRAEEPVVEKPPAEKRPAGRPRRQRTEEELRAEQQKQERIVRRREGAAMRRQERAQRRTERKERKEAQPTAAPPIEITRGDVRVTFD